MYHYIRDRGPGEDRMLTSLSVAPGEFEWHMKLVAEFAKKGKVTLMTGE